MLVVGQLGRDEVEPPLGGGVDGRLVHRPERPLRERRERADRLDLVAEQLDAQRVAAGGREDVDDPAADRELAAFLHPLHPLVARQGQLLGEAVDPRLVADGQVEPRRASFRRRRPLRERRRRRADEPAGGEHVERPGPLAHEMRRRLEPRVPADAAAREERDLLLAEVPGRRLGRVSRVRVLGEQHEQRAAEVQVERREDGRQPGLRHTGGGSSQVLRERLEALGCRQLARERQQRGCG